MNEFRRTYAARPYPWRADVLIWSENCTDGNMTNAQAEWEGVAWAVSEELAMQIADYQLRQELDEIGWSYHVKAIHIMEPAT